ncbi:YeiH family protein [Granulicella sibirica]|nr:putative sulfate exporter family transporter [Granulicella sibirica]
MSTKNIFFLGLILAAAGVLSPPLALLAGLVFALTVEHPFAMESHDLSKFLLQASVVALGFGMDLHEVIHAGRSGFVYTAVSISVAMLLGLLLGRVMRVPGKASFLITCGTAICGGSAIAAIGPITDANEEEMGISLGTVFTLNSVALVLFPFVGTRLHMTQSQFGLWAALAIHDTSSVVGAAAKYGAVALTIGTTVKLARALWIVPLSFATAYAMKSKAKVKIPWFILLFCVAAVVRTYLPTLHGIYTALSGLGRSGMAVTLFLIGTGLSREMFRKVGVRPMVQGVALWIVVAVASLMAIRAGLIAI